MNHEQLFVGMVAIGLGVVGIGAAISNWEGYYRLRKVRWVETVSGRSVARAMYALLGIGLVGLGLAIAVGYRPSYANAQGQIRPLLPSSGDHE